MGYADILAAQLEDPDDLEMVGTIRRNGSHLLEIINDILDLSRIEANRLDIEKKRFDPVALLQEVHTMMQVRLQGKPVRLGLRFESPMPATIESDRRRLKQILVNLVGNAIKFTDRGQVDIVATCERDRGCLRCRVIDTGIGISAADQQSIFEDFSQIDASNSRGYEGTGLGLSISRRLAISMGGSIEVDSEPGRGSEFTLAVRTGDLRDVSFSDHPAEALSQPAQPEPAAIRLDCRVLVVDDRRPIRLIAMHYLEEAGARVQTADDGEQAVDFVRRSLRGEIPPFDVVLMDMQMPVLDGYEATRQLRRLGFESPIIALTAGAMQRDRDRSLAAGCDDHLTKPIDATALTSLVYQYSDRPQASAKGSYKVMVVEDHRDAAEAMALGLEIRGHDVEITQDAESALLRLADFRPEIVICDINLPGRNGYELATELRSRIDHSAPVLIALTGDAGTRDDPRASVFDHVLLKPVPIERLCDLFGLAHDSC